MKKITIFNGFVVFMVAWIDNTFSGSPNAMAHATTAVVVYAICAGLWFWYRSRARKTLNLGQHHERID